MLRGELYERLVPGPLRHVQVLVGIVERGGEPVRRAARLRGRIFYEGRCAGAQRRSSGGDTLPATSVTVVHSPSVTVARTRAPVAAPL